jgi:hypothetical protein
LERQVFRDKLHETLRKVLLSGVQDFIAKRMDAYRRSIRLLATLDRKYEGESLIRDGLPTVFSSISKNMAKEDTPSLAQLYLQTIDELAKKFPRETEWRQNEQRFFVQEDDPFFISIGKKGKSATRSVSQKWHGIRQKISALYDGDFEPLEPWKQQVPLRRAVQYHLLDDNIVSSWIHALEQVRLTIITEIEQWLVTECKMALREGGQIDGLTLVRVLEEKTGQQDSDLNQQVIEAIDDLESEINEYVDQIDTIERTRKSYSKQRLESRRQTFNQILEILDQQWLKSQKVLLGRAEDIARFLTVHTDITAHCRNLIHDFESYFREILNQPLDEFHKMLKQAIKRINEEYSPDQIAELGKQLSDQITGEILQPVNDLLKQQVLSRKAEHCFQDLLMSVNQLPEETQLVYNAKLDERPVSVDQRKMQWRLLAIRTIREQIMSSIRPEERNYNEFLAGILGELFEIEDILSANFESAITAFDEREEEEVEHPHKIVREALKRVLAKVEKLRNWSEDKRTDITTALQQGNEKFGDLLIAMLHEGDHKELQLLNAKYKVKETTKDWRTVLDSRWARILDQLTLFRRFGWKKGKGYLKDIRAFLGFKPSRVQESQRADIASYLSETDQKVRELPYIYRRLFDFEELADQRFFVPVLEEVNSFKKGFERWQDPLDVSSVAVVGEKGSGKSTFLNIMVDKELGEANIVRLELQQTIWTEKELVSLLAEEMGYSNPKTANDLIETIRQEQTHEVVIIESVQNCFVRNINGYEAIEKLCYLISETREQLFWVASSSLYGWRFLDNILQLSEYFSQVVRTDTLDASQIEEIIMNRHRSSGYSLHFEPGDEIRKERAYRKVMDQEDKAQTFLRERYFEKLTELAEGNASVAMIFWIRSIRDFDDTCFYIRPMEVTSVEMIEDLSPQVLFSLAAVVLHDTVSVEDLSMILNVTNEESRLLLNRLRSRGLLIRVDGLFTINHLMYRQIVRVLKERNIIHLV